MQMNNPIGVTPLDNQPNGIVGKPLDRVDGRLKVTGGAVYAYEVAQGPQTAYGYVVQASIGKGRIRSIDSRVAEQMPGVILVLTHLNAPEQGTGDHQRRASGPGWHRPCRTMASLSLSSWRRHSSKPAPRPTQCGSIMKPRRALTRCGTACRVPGFPKAAACLRTVRSAISRPAFAAAPVQIDVTYTTPLQSHAMMEPHATLAIWDGDKLTLHTSNQMLNWGVAAVARTLKIPQENVRLVSPFIGGGFGSKLWVNADAILAAIAARQLKRPVKTALTRQQIFMVTTHRSDTIQHIRIGTDHDGHIQAIGHDVFSGNLPTEQSYEGAALQTRTLYAGANRLTRHRLVPLDVPVASSMRAPGEAVGLLALECAMDELAERLNLDPIELRIRNEPAEDPERHVPYSSRHLIPCLREGARRFGWNKRQAKPGQVRDGRWLVGIGVAAATRGNPLVPIDGQRKARSGRDRHGADGDDGYRHRELHDPDADRRGDARCAAGRCPHGAGRYRVSVGRRFRRFIRRRQFRFRIVRGLHEPSCKAGTRRRDGFGIRQLRERAYLVWRCVEAAAESRG